MADKSKEPGFELIPPDVDAHTQAVELELSIAVRFIWQQLPEKLQKVMHYTGFLSTSQLSGWFEYTIPAVLAATEPGPDGRGACPLCGDRSKDGRGFHAPVGLKKHLEDPERTGCQGAQLFFKHAYREASYFDRAERRLLGGITEAEVAEILESHNPLTKARSSEKPAG